MPDVFISYSRQDRKTAQHIIGELRKKRLDVFFDRDALVAGESFDATLTEAIRSARVVVVLLSANTARSRYVERELASALESAEGKTIIPVLLDGEATRNWVWPLVANRQAIDLRQQDDKQVIDAVMQSFPRRKARAAAPWVVIAILVVVAGLAVFSLQAPGSRPPELERTGTEVSVWALTFAAVAVSFASGYFVGKKRK
jgi:hypothetical protein